MKGEGGDALPPSAYFMIKQRRLLAVDSDPFPVESRIKRKGLDSVWDAVVEVRNRTQKDMGAGRDMSARPGPSCTAFGMSVLIRLLHDQCQSLVAIDSTQVSSILDLHAYLAPPWATCDRRPSPSRARTGAGRGTAAQTGGAGSS